MLYTVESDKECKSECDSKTPAMTSSGKICVS